MDEFLTRLAETTKPIIVEGKKDRKALERIGARNVIQIKGPLFEFIESISSKYDKIIILTDLDREGKKLYGKLAGALSQRGVEIDNYFREYLLRTKISHIEGIDTFFENLAEKTGKR